MLHSGDRQNACFYLPGLCFTYFQAGLDPGRKATEVAGFHLPGLLIRRDRRPSKCPFCRTVHMGEAKLFLEVAGKLFLAILNSKSPLNYLLTKMEVPGRPLVLLEHSASALEPSLSVSSRR